MLLKKNISFSTHILAFSPLRPLEKNIRNIASVSSMPRNLSWFFRSPIEVFIGVPKANTVSLDFWQFIEDSFTNLKPTTCDRLREKIRPWT
jgi:hypothetical protein